MADPDSRLRPHRNANGHQPTQTSDQGNFSQRHGRSRLSNDASITASTRGRSHRPELQDTANLHVLDQAEQGPGRQTAASVTEQLSMSCEALAESRLDVINALQKSMSHQEETNNLQKQLISQLEEQVQELKATLERERNRRGRAEENEQPARTNAAGLQTRSQPSSTSPRRLTAQQVVNPQGQEVRLQARPQQNISSVPTKRRQMDDPTDRPPRRKIAEGLHSFEEVLQKISFFDGTQTTPGIQLTDSQKRMFEPHLQVFKTDRGFKMLSRTPKDCSKCNVARECRSQNDAMETSATSSCKRCLFYGLLCMIAKQDGTMTVLPRPWYLRPTLTAQDEHYWVAEPADVYEFDSD